MAVKRRLAAILAADVAGYSRLMGEDEDLPLHVVGSLCWPYRTEPIRSANPARSKRLISPGTNSSSI